MCIFCFLCERAIRFGISSNLLCKYIMMAEDITRNTKCFQSSYCIFWNQFVVVWWPQCYSISSCLWMIHRGVLVHALLTSFPCVWIPQLVILSIFPSIHVFHLVWVMGNIYIKEPSSLCGTYFLDLITFNFLLSHSTPYLVTLWLSISLISLLSITPVFIFSLLSGNCKDARIT